MVASICEVILQGLPPFGSEKSSWMNQIEKRLETEKGT